MAADRTRPLYDDARGTDASELDPALAVAAVHRFLLRCRAWGTDREIPKHLARLEGAPRLEDAARLHQWVTWVSFVDHALTELESGHLDPWFLDTEPASPGTSV